MKPLSRRELLRFGVTGAAAIALSPLLDACARATRKGGAPTSALDGLLAQKIRDGDMAGLQAAFGAGDFVAGPGQIRVPFGLLEPGVGRVDIDAGAARVWVQGLGGGGVEGPFDARWHAFTKPEPRPSPQGFYATSVTFDRPGQWSMLAEVQTGARRLAGTAAFEVLAKSSTVDVGERARGTQTPTFADHRGVNPVCTRQPPCPFHTISLADALRARRPIALQFSTPLFCESRVCGPSLKELIIAARSFPSPTAVIHVEIYRDLHKSGLVKAVEDWGLQSEPWLFSIDRDGVVRGRLEGPQTADEIRSALLQADRVR